MSTEATNGSHRVQFGTNATNTGVSDYSAHLSAEGAEEIDFCEMREDEPGTIGEQLVAELRRVGRDYGELASDSERELREPETEVASF